MRKRIRRESKEDEGGQRYIKLREQKTRQRVKSIENERKMKEDDVKGGQRKE